MKPDKIIIRSQDAEIYDKDSLSATDFMNLLLSYVGINTDEIYYTGNTGKLSHDFLRYLEYPTKINVRKIILPGSIPSFNNGNRTLKCIGLHATDNTQHQRFDIVMPINDIYTTYTEFQTALNTQLAAVPGSGGALSCIINQETGILTFRSTNINFKVFVIERNLKFGFLYPWLTFDGTSPYDTIGHAPVQLSQTKNIYLKSNIETNNYMSDGDTKILSVIPYTLDIKDIVSGSYTYINHSDQFTDIHTADYNKVTFEFIDDEKNLMNFNYLPVTIEIDLKYD